MVYMQGENDGFAGSSTTEYKNSLKLLYQNMKNDWDKAFPEIKLTITADVTIRRIGEETFHSRKS